MKKILSIIAIIAIFQSCKKEHDNAINAEITINSKAYTYPAGTIKQSSYTDYNGTIAVGIAHSYTMSFNNADYDVVVKVEPKRYNASNYYLVARTYDVNADDPYADYNLVKIDIHATNKVTNKTYYAAKGSKLIITSNTNSTSLTGGSVNGTIAANLVCKTATDIVTLNGYFNNFKVQ
jgi:hypothetical protein